MTMLRIKTALLVLLFASSCEGILEPARTAPINPGNPSEPNEPAPVVDTGEALFAQRCASCHGATGEGTADAYQLRSPVRPYALWVVRNGRDEGTFPGGMDRITSLSDEQLTKIFDYLHAVPMPTDGEALYVRFCGNCHGPEGKNGRADKDVDGEDAEEIFEAAREGHGHNRYSDAEEYMPAWTTAELSDAQLEAIAAYLGQFGDGDDDDDDDDEGDDDDEDDDDEHKDGGH